MHADYPHHPGRLPGCEECESKCHCDEQAVADGRETRCVWPGHDMSQSEALSLAVLALNTMQEPDATSNEDWNLLEAHAEEAKAILIELRREVNGRG